VPTHLLTFRAMGALKRLYAATGDASKLRAIEARRLAALHAKAEGAEASPADKRSYAYAALTIEPEDLRDPDAALEMALAADALANGADAQIQYVVAMAWLRHGDRAKAEAAIGRALELLPADSEDRTDYEKLKAEVIALAK